MVNGRHFFEQGSTVNVERSPVERKVSIPLTVISLGRDDVDSLGGVVEVGEIDVNIILGHGLKLSLGDEDLMFMLDDHLTLLGIEVHVRPVDLGSGPWDKRRTTITALNT
jgi:hypothetical protein|tara:strand:+ start:812 stop:1141 length:330 start_codon:yes stop_codon:yes gene_type:complete